MIEENHLSADEYIITQSSGLNIALTNKRIKHVYELWQRKQYDSIMLQDIHKIQIKYSSNIRVLYCALFFFASAYLLVVFSTVLFGNSTMLMIPMVLGAFAMIYYLTTISSYVIIKTKDGEIKKIHVPRSYDDEAFNIVSRTELAMREI